MKKLINRLIVCWLSFLLASCASIRSSQDEMNLIRANGLCFALHKKDNLEAYYRNTNRPEEADKVVRDNELYHQYVMKQFSELFDYCPVYFFDYDQKDALIAREPVLLNANLEPDPSIELPPTIIIMQYNIRDLGENELGSERFFIEGTDIEVRPNTFTTERLKVENDSVFVHKPVPIPLRSDKSQLLPTDLKKLNKQLSGFQ